MYKMPFGTFIYLKIIAIIIGVVEYSKVQKVVVENVIQIHFFMK